MLQIFLFSFSHFFCHLFFHFLSLFLFRRKKKFPCFIKPKPKPKHSYGFIFLYSFSIHNLLLWIYKTTIAIPYSIVMPMSYPLGMDSYCFFSLHFGFPNNGTQKERRKKERRKKVFFRGFRYIFSPRFNYALKKNWIIIQESISPMQNVLNMKQFHISFFLS